MYKVSLIIVLFFTIACSNQKSQVDKTPLSLEARVMDRADMIAKTAEDSVYRLIEDLEIATGSQIAVLTIDTLNGEEINDFSIRMAERMRLGREKHLDGVLFTFSRKDKSMRVEVGIGLEKILKDEVVVRIIQEVIVPKFREEKYGSGIYLGVKEVKELIEQNKDLIGQN
ncbi:MAG: TPM domain-containing protein [Cyclobacteriaceae bacterium]